MRREEMESILAVGIDPGKWTNYGVAMVYPEISYTLLKLLVKFLVKKIKGSFTDILVPFFERKSKNRKL